MWEVRRWAVRGERVVEGGRGYGGGGGGGGGILIAAWE